jgi:hypothetical protein
MSGQQLAQWLRPILGGSWNKQLQGIRGGTRDTADAQRTKRSLIDDFRICDAHEYAAGVAFNASHIAAATERGHQRGWVWNRHGNLAYRILAYRVLAYRSLPNGALPRGS